VARCQGWCRRIRPLAIGAVVGFSLVLQLAFFENWLEVTRLTFFLWALLAIATTEAEATGQGSLNRRGPVEPLLVSTPSRRPAIQASH
jgi:hypothetical protein